MSDSMCFLFCLIWAYFGWNAREINTDWKAKRAPNPAPPAQDKEEEG